MQITALDILKKEFKKTFRGYDVKEVREFLDSASKEYSDLLLQVKSLNEQLIELEVQLRDFKMIEKTLQQTIFQAHEASDKILANARTEAQNYLKSADREKELILNEARLEVKAAKIEVVELMTKKDAIISRLKILLSSELELINQIEKEEFKSTQSSQALGTGKENFQIDEAIEQLKNK